MTLRVTTSHEQGHLRGRYIVVGDDIHAFARALWGLNRSITGAGVRETLGKIQTHLPHLSIHAVPTGTQVFDWTIPKEWHVTEAYLITPSGQKICDFSENNLHLVGYSVPVRQRMSLADLQAHLHSLPDQPDAIPYVTSYYAENWGFCLCHEDRQKLEEGMYEVVIKSTLFDGVLNYGELILPGQSAEEVFLSTYICHPSMANNELSGPTVMTYVLKWLSDMPDRRYTYRIVFVPETIGSLTYLSQHYQEMQKKVIAGFNVTCIGDDRSYSYLPSRLGNTLSDRIAQHVLRHTDPDFNVYTWLHRGGDERQYCAPGIDLPVASIMRTKFAEYPEYHTSLDTLEDVVTPSGLQGGYEVLCRAIEALEQNKVYKVLVLGEPQMGRRGLYPTVSSKSNSSSFRHIMNVISWCDGNHTLLDIAERVHLPIWMLYDLINVLQEQELIAEELP